jgi:NH3-dependent NAD+ synthetase/predicted amidohydrolase
MGPFSVYLAQISTPIGDFEGAIAKILSHAREAKAQGAHLAVFPELALCGYPAEDWLLVPHFIQKNQEALDALAQKSADLPPLIVGTPWSENGNLYNAAVLLSQGKIQDVTTKQALPSYGVFDEARYFAHDRPPRLFSVAGLRLSVPICEDFWQPEAMQRYNGLNPDVTVVINASPYETGKQEKRLHKAAQCPTPVVYVNRVGGQDGLVFDGRSFVYDNGTRVALPLAEEAGCTIALSPASPTKTVKAISEEEEIYTILKRGLRDYVDAVKPRKVLLGLSGGMDSALTAAIAVDALGADRVYGVMIPSVYTSQASLDDAAFVANALAIELLSIPLSGAMDVLGDVLDHPAGITHENLQARLRGLILMAHANRNNDLLLNTSNKSESAMGYATLYGDMCGGFAVLQDVYKTQVYRLAQWRNRQGVVFNDSTLTKEPTAELRPDQKDTDSLPPYDRLDHLLQHFIEGYGSLEEAITQGFSGAEAEKVYRALHGAEYKRRQAPLGIKITPRAFGPDWRFPVMRGRLPF